MIEISVESTAVETRSGTSARTSKPYTIRTQRAWAYLFDRLGHANPHPTQMQLTLEDGAEAYPVGRYLLAPQSIYCGKYGDLQVGRVALIPDAAAHSQLRRMASS